MIILLHDNVEFSHTVRQVTKKVSRYKNHMTAINRVRLNFSETHHYLVDQLRSPVKIILVDYTSKKKSLTLLERAHKGATGGYYITLFSPILLHEPPLSHPPGEALHNETD